MVQNAKSCYIRPACDSSVMVTKRRRRMTGMPKKIPGINGISNIENLENLVVLCLPYSHIYPVAHTSYYHALLDKVAVYGDITDSEIHNQFFGHYSFGHKGGNWSGNHVHDNVGYGFDPHDDSDHATIANNHVHDNGWHGISEFFFRSFHYFFADLYAVSFRAIFPLLFRFCLRVRVCLCPPPSPSPTRPPQ